MTEEEFKQRWLSCVLAEIPDFTWIDAESAWEAITPAEHREGYEDDPEGAAREEMQYWNDD